MIASFSAAREDVAAKERLVKHAEDRSGTQEKRADASVQIEQTAVSYTVIYTTLHPHSCKLSRPAPAFPKHSFQNSTGSTKNVISDNVTV